MINLSIIIVNYQSQDYLPQCLEIIKKRVNTPHEVIVIDNNKLNRGFGKAANLGAQKAKGELLLFLNPDTRILEGNFEELVRCFQAQSNLGIVGLKMVLEDGSLQPYSFGKKISLWRVVFLRRDGAWFGRLTTGCPVSTQIDWTSGGAMVVRRDLFERLGGFDEHFYMYFEDQDLCLRAKNSGFKVIVWDKIVVKHFGGAPLSGKSHQSKRLQLKMYYDSQEKFVRKHYGVLYALMFRIVRLPWMWMKIRSTMR